ncbi:MAG TPA: ABC transporter permease [Spirochaetota bacterium]|nr:ABC transporter permease [Spirochaetota bacterium]HOS41285.1 ABC transporter permease [Spirochaetota bacterium]HPI23332.1 ABC transporter permease [Spirochaetota bacterium]HPU86970.1 ABC transporter permease [Spirochaetota bacterium]
MMTLKRAVERHLRFGIVRSFIKKEFKQMFRDPRMRMTMFVPPVVMLLLNGYAISTDVEDIRMAVYDADRTRASRELVERFTASGYFIADAALDSEKQIARLLDTGAVELVLHVERGFSRRITSGKKAALQIIVDGTDSSRAAVIVAYVNEITAGFSSAYLDRRVRSLAISKNIQMVKFKPPVELRERSLFNPQLLSRYFFLSGLLGMLVSIVAISMTSMAIVKEREAGTIDQIIVSPIRPAELIAGKIVPYAIVAFIDIVLITAVMVAWFKVPFNGSVLFLFASGILFIVATSAMGLFISTISKTQQQAILSTFLFFIPALLFSGFIFPIYAMPETIQAITLLNPFRYFITISRAVFLKGAGAIVLWKELAALVIIALVLFYFSARRFRRGLE